jgi:hypothetical protein
VRRVIQLQWRGIAVVILIVADVIFFSVVFVYMDNTTQGAIEHFNTVQPWVFCLIMAGGDKNQCIDKARSFVVNEVTVMAVLILLSVSSFHKRQKIFFEHSNN